jgi:hypothetical protein
MGNLEMEKQVAETARVVSDWKTNQAKIETAISDANVRLAKADASRKKFVLDANLGNPDAIKEIAKARAENNDALGDTADLGLALSDAKARLIEAEREAAIARNNLAEFEAEVLKRRRIDVAGQLDAAIAAFADLYREYEKLGDEIINMPDVMPRSLHGISNVEGAQGARRVRASLPRFFWKLFPGAVYDEMKTENLATAEARFWNLLPPVETTTKAA